MRGKDGDAPLYTFPPRCADSVGQNRLPPDTPTYGSHRGRFSISRPVFFAKLIDRFAYPLLAHSLTCGEPHFL